jgi:hypothetical protein
MKAAKVNSPHRRDIPSKIRCQDRLQIVRLVRLLTESLNMMAAMKAIVLIRGAAPIAIPDLEVAREPKKLSII